VGTSTQELDPPKGTPPRGRCRPPSNKLRKQEHETGDQGGHSLGFTSAHPLLFDRDNVLQPRVGHDRENTMKNTSKQGESIKNNKNGAKGIDNEPIASERSNRGQGKRQQSSDVELRGKTRSKSAVGR